MGDVVDPMERIAEALERIAAALDRQAASCVSTVEPVALSKEDAARFIGESVAAIEHLIRTRKIEYVQHGNQRGRVIPIQALHDFLRNYRQASGDEMLGKRKHA